MSTLAIATLLAGLIAVADAETVDMLAVSPYLYDRVQVVEDPTPKDAWYARAVVRNVLGLHNETEREPTSLGDVHINYRTSRPSALKDKNSADEACVVLLPVGVIAIPECVSVLEEETETIYLYRYLGG